MSPDLFVCSTTGPLGAIALCTEPLQSRRCGGGSLAHCQREVVRNAVPEVNSFRLPGAASLRLLGCRPRSLSGYLFHPRISFTESCNWCRIDRTFFFTMLNETTDESKVREWQPDASWLFPPSPRDWLQEGHPVCFSAGRDHSDRYFADR